LAVLALNVMENVLANAIQDGLILVQDNNAVLQLHVLLGVLNLEQNVMFVIHKEQDILQTVRNVILEKLVSQTEVANLYRNKIKKIVKIKRLM
jgi:hypothetical protein